MDEHVEIEALKTAFVAWCAESEGRAPSAAEADDFATMICSGNVVTGEDLQPEVYPEFTSMPPELLVRFVPIPAQVPQAEFLYVPSTAPPRDTDEQIKTALFVNEWNICWESGQLRHQMFGEDTKYRFSPDFFPFTEPSAQVCIGCTVCGGSGCQTCSDSGWLEILGSGSVDPEVFKFVDYDPEEVTGFAFGMGVERVAMLRYGINDIRALFENDMRFLQQF